MRRICLALSGRWRVEGFRFPGRCNGWICFPFWGEEVVMSHRSKNDCCLRDNPWFDAGDATVGFVLPFRGEEIDNAAIEENCEFPRKNRRIAKARSWLHSAVAAIRRGLSSCVVRSKLC